MLTKTLILTQTAIHAKMKRMAYEVYENHFLEKEILLIGVSQGGNYLGQALQNILKDVAPFEVSFVKANINRSQTVGMMEMYGDIQPHIFQGKAVIVVDDVLYSGRTLLSVVAQILTSAPKCIQTFVLIDRGHRQMPISPDYVGMELATTLQQHVDVQLLENGGVEAYLV
jgi:pyrimidine operon attenuation protein / uracil phosphoribosyltransferase